MSLTQRCVVSVLSKKDGSVDAAIKNTAPNIKRPLVLVSCLCQLVGTLITPVVCIVKINLCISGEISLIRPKHASEKVRFFFTFRENLIGKVKSVFKISVFKFFIKMYMVQLHLTFFFKSSTLMTLRYRPPHWRHAHYLEG